MNEWKGMAAKMELWPGQRFVGTGGISISSFSAMYCLPEINRNPPRPLPLNRVSPQAPEKKKDSPQVTHQAKGRGRMQSQVSLEPPLLTSLPELKTTSIHFTGKETGDRPRGGARRITG